MHKWLMLIMFIGACLLAVVVMTVGPLAPHTVEHAEEEVDPNQLKIVASNFQFDKEEYRVAQGKTMKVTLENKNGGHGIEIVGMDVSLEGGQSADVTFDKPGTYEIKCNILCGTGHAEMISTLIVE